MANTYEAIKAISSLIAVNLIAVIIVLYTLMPVVEEST